MLIGGKAALGADQNGPGLATFPGQTGWLIQQRLIAPQKPPVCGPGGQHLVQRHQIGHLRHKGRTTLLGGLHRMGLQAVLADAFGIGVAGLHRHEPRHPQFHRLFHDEIGARLLDRREQQPQVGRQALRRGLPDAAQHPGPLARLLDLRPPFAIAAIEQRHRIARRQSHDVEQIVGLIHADSYRLPCAQRLFYKEPDPSL